MKKHLLCITPDFSRSGAPIALYGFLRILIKKDCFNISIMAYGTGDLMSSFVELLGKDHIIVLNGLNPTSEFRYMLQNNYDLILLNTAAVYPFSFYFQNTVIPVYWWIHEAPGLIEESFPAFPNPHLLSSNFRLFAPSEGAAKIFRTQYSYDISVLPVPVYMPEPTTVNIPIEIPSDRVIFLVPAAYTYLKGQDILLSAILTLPEEYKRRSFFVFCGYSLEKQREYKNAIADTISNMDNVLMLEDLPQETVFFLISKSHCVVAPSRIDTIPLSIVEGIMYKKLTLVSCSTGISHYIQDCVHGFVFKDQEELTKRLLLIINDHDSLHKIEENGHNIYTDFFSPEAVSAIIDIIL